MILPQISAAVSPINRLFAEGSVAGLTDSQLVERSVDSHDEAAFTALVARHGPIVLATCRAVVRDHAVADESFRRRFWYSFARPGQFADANQLAAGCIASLTELPSRPVPTPCASELENGRPAIYS